MVYLQQDDDLHPASTLLRRASKAQLEVPLYDAGSLVV